MFDSLIWFIFMLLVLIGTVAICYAIMLKLLLPRNNDDIFIVLPCGKNTYNVRKKAYGLKMKICLFCNSRNCKVVVIDFGLSDFEKSDLLEICKECNGIYYTKPENIKDFFDGRF